MAGLRVRVQGVRVEFRVRVRAKVMKRATWP